MVATGLFLLLWQVQLCVSSSLYLITPPIITDLAGFFGLWSSSTESMSNWEYVNIWTIIFVISF